MPNPIGSPPPSPSPDSDVQEALRPAAGVVIAGRYELVDLLGRGGHGDVWEARDALTGETVALKLLRLGQGADPARTRREIATLRLLRLPGVVRLLDEGTEQGCPFLVMDRVQGSPFPGAPTPVPWSALEGTARAALETLARIHAAAIIHRDLKPENVLVDAGGRPSILDFGLSSAGPQDEQSARAGSIEGSFPYLAPEQIRGDAVGPETDLYAFGVLLYEALAGRLPHAATDLRKLMLARLTQRPEPLGRVAPDVPQEVAALVDRMLAIEPQDRPRSAAEALAILRGQPSRRAETLPRLGGDGAVRALVEAAEEGRSACVVGPRGSGRTRCLAEAADALERGGRAVIRIEPSPWPLESLVPALGSPPGRPDERMAEVGPRARDRVAEVLARGAVLIADDVDRLDRSSREALLEASGSGSILFAATEGFSGLDPALTVPLEPLAEAALRPLFAGPERILCLPSDAARELARRTGGLAARVADEVDAWARAGLARWDGAALVITRDALDRMETTRAAPLPREEGPALPPHLEELAAWLELAFPHFDFIEIASAMGRPLWQMEALVAELADRGAARFQADRSILEIPSRFAPRLPSARRRAMHRALGSIREPGSEGRLLHLVRGTESGSTDECIEVAAEALASGRRAALSGRLGQAVAAVREGILFLRRRPDPSDPRAIATEEALLALWTEIALSESTPAALDRLLYELCRAASRTDFIAHLEALVRAALALAAGADRALAMADAVPPFADGGLERLRQALRVQGSRRASPERLSAVLAEVEAWVEASDQPSARAAFFGWAARREYQEGRFEEAARLHKLAAAAEPFVISRAAALIHAASALMEAFKLDEAAATAEEARALAAASRHAHNEGRAEWILRSVAYRAGAAAAPDLELVQAVEALGVPDLEALVSLNEAAVAYRAGAVSLARDLAERARRVWAGMKKRYAALLARCHSIACGLSPADGEVISIAEQAEACPVPGLGIQMLGLLALAVPGAFRRWDGPLERLCEGVPQACWSTRMEVLSVAEARAALLAAQASLDRGYK